MNTIHFLPSLQRGGAEGYMLKLVRFLQKSGGKHYVFSILDGPLRASVEECGAEVIILGKNPFKYLSKARAVREDVNILQGWLVHGNLLASFFKLFRFKSAKVVWGLRHTLENWKHFTFLTRFLILFSTPFSKFVDKIISNSNKGALDHFELGYPKHSLVVLPNGFVLPTATAENEGLITIISVGRYHFDKGQDLLLSAALELLNENHRFKLIFVGRGFDELEKSIPSSLHESILFVGEVTSPQQYLLQSSAFVLPSRTEAFPNSLGEAMSCGLYCIATDVGDVKVLLAEEGDIIEANDKMALKKAIMRLLDLPDHQRSQCGVRLRQRIEDEFLLQNSLQNYLSLYRSLLE